MGIVDLVESMSPVERKAALTALDAVTRPLTVREIEKALRFAGMPKSRAVMVSSALKMCKINIIAVTGEEHA